MISTALEEPKIRIDSEVTRRVRQHARAHMQTEVCGVLIGKLCDGIITIEAPIEAFTAAQAGAHVTFTQTAWETIYRVKDKSYPEDRIVGWYHSHPGFGVFLSDHDTFIHQHFFSSPDQVAWVYDPHSDEEGCFGWVDGMIRRIATISVADNNEQAPRQTARQVAALLNEDETNTPQQPIVKRLRLRSLILSTSLGFPHRFAVLVQNAFLSCLPLVRSFIPSTQANGQRLRMLRVLSPSGRKGLEEAPHSTFDTRSGNATEHLPFESGK